MGKVKEVQKYLKKRGFMVAETSIVDMAIEIAERLGPGQFVFVQEAMWRKEDKIKGIREVAEETSEEEEEEEDPIRGRVLQDIGHASMCWDKPEGAGAFDTEQAIEIGDSLCQFIHEQIAEAKKEDKRGDKNK